MSRNCRIRVPEEFRWNRLAGPWLDHFPLMSGKDRFFLIVNLNEERTITILQAGKKGGQAVIVILGPALAGMIVATGTLQTDAQEELGHFLGPDERVAQPAIKPSRRIAVVAATRRQDKSSEFVFRHVAQNGL